MAKESYSLLAKKEHEDLLEGLTVLRKESGSIIISEDFIKAEGSTTSDVGNLFIGVLKLIGQVVIKEIMLPSSGVGDVTVADTNSIVLENFGMAIADSIEMVVGTVEGESV